MMPRTPAAARPFLSAALLAACAAAAPPADSSSAEPGVRLRVIAHTAGPLKGAIRFALFSRASARSWKDPALAAVELPACSSSCAWESPPLPEGRYALAVFHDVNGNHELDKSLLGMPVEPYGFSNNARHALGPPSIEEATVRVVRGQAAVQVLLR